MEDTPQDIKHGADPGSPSRHLHSSPARFLSVDEIKPDQLRCQRSRRSLLRHSLLLPGERPRRSIRGIEIVWKPRAVPACPMKVNVALLSSTAFSRLESYPSTSS